MTTKPETAIVWAEPTALAKPDYGIDVARVVAMRAAVEEVVSKVLREGEHYGALPGTKGKDGKPPKKMLFQPGAEVLCQVFRLRPEYKELAVIEREDFLMVKILCRLFNSVTGENVGEAIASANTREEKYVAQTTARLCPQCGKAAIIKGKEEYGGGWLCYVKKDGCGAKFSDDDKRMIQDQGGALNSTKVWGLYHVVESIAQKRAFVKATRTATGTSDIFTDEDAPQDDEEHDQRGRQAAKPAATPKVTPSEARELNEALKAAQIGTYVDPELEPTEQQAQQQKAKFRYANEMLKEWGEAEVKSTMELTPDQLKRLIEAARSGKKPVGW
jgi:ssDNA-binding Zn-finger/Zn-ribbon topoisomerase 1